MRDSEEGLVANGSGVREINKETLDPRTLLTKKQKQDDKKHSRAQTSVFDMRCSHSVVSGVLI